jgi:hypothetical protein
VAILIAEPLLNFSFIIEILCVVPVSDPFQATNGLLAIRVDPATPQMTFAKSIPEGSPSYWIYAVPLFGLMLQVEMPR